MPIVESKTGPLLWAKRLVASLGLWVEELNSSTITAHIVILYGMDVCETSRLQLETQHQLLSAPKYASHSKAF